MVEGVIMEIEFTEVIKISSWYEYKSLENKNTGEVYILLGII